MERPLPTGGGMQFGVGLTPMVRNLLIANGAVYVLELLWRDFFLAWFALEPAVTVLGGQAWRIATYMFLHSPRDPSHLLFNMLGLWLFGVVFERRWGSREFLLFYLVSGLIAALWVIGIGFLAGRAGDVTVGASGAIYALIAAFGLVFAEQHILLGFLIPIRAKYMVLIILGMTILYALAGQAGVSWAAHLGGLFAGLFLVRKWYFPRMLWSDIRRYLLRPRAPRRQPRHLRVVPRDDDHSDGSGYVH